jgi:hemoglobin
VRRQAIAASGCRNNLPLITQPYKCQKESPMTTTLYRRLGGAEGITRLVDDVVAAHLSNPIVKTRFENVKDMDKLKKRACEFFCVGSGGPETYTGKDMLATHKGMNISEQEYLAVMDDIVGAMNKNRLDEDAKKDVIAILYSLKGEIIRV